MKKRDNQKPIINQSKLEKNSTRITTNCLRNLEPKKISESNKQKKNKIQVIRLRSLCEKVVKKSILYLFLSLLLLIINIHLRKFFVQVNFQPLFLCISDLTFKFFIFKKTFQTFFDDGHYESRQHEAKRYHHHHMESERERKHLKLFGCFFVCLFVCLWMITNRPI